MRSDREKQQRRNDWGIAMLKTIVFTESRTLELWFETFNTFNHAQFDGASSVKSNCTNTTPNEGCGLAANGSVFGEVMSAASPRIAQVAAKFNL
jgi:hypothetical protein